MKKIIWTVVLEAFLIGAAGVLANGFDVPSIAIYNGRTFLAAKLTISADYPPISKTAFISTPVLPIKKGTILPARGVVEAAGENQGWSISEHDFVIGARTVKYPVFGVVNFASIGNFTVIASTTVIKVGLKAGEVLHSDGYLIEAKRAIKAGETIPTVCMEGKGGYSIISIDAVPQAKDKDAHAKPQPCLTLIDERVKLSDRTNVLEAWRLSNESVIKKGIPPIYRGIK